MRKRSTRYRGKVCIHHPELGGLRYKCNWTCCECARVKRRGQVARAKLRQQDYVRRAECALEIVRELGLKIACKSPVGSSRIATTTMGTLKAALGVLARGSWRRLRRFALASCGSD